MQSRKVSERFGSVANQSTDIRRRFVQRGARGGGRAKKFLDSAYNKDEKSPKIHRHEFRKPSGSALLDGFQLKKREKSLADQIHTC